jgi:hypothetical protein
MAYVIIRLDEMCVYGEVVGMVSKPGSRWKTLVTILWFLAPSVSIETEDPSRFLAKIVVLA